MIQRKYLFILSSLILIHTGVGQQAQILTRNAPENTLEKQAIQIKWYSSEFPFYQEGAHVYRRELGTTNWEKLTERPILLKSVFDTTIYAFDPDLEFFTAIMKEVTKEAIEGEPFLFINLLIKSFQSQWFADFLGIFYEDKTVVYGKSYEYKINKIANNRELLLGISEPIVTELFKPENPVDQFIVEQRNQKFELDWKVDPQRYYAVNIHQIFSSGAVIRVNENPLMTSEVTDSLGNVRYPSPKFKIDSLEVGKEYSYSLTGLDFFGEETVRTDTISRIFRDEVPPPPPTNLKGKADSMKVNLTWNLSVAEDMRDFQLLRSKLSEGPFESVFSTNDAASYVDTLKVPGPYYYYLSAFDHAGNEASSRKIFVDVQDVSPPRKPENLTVKADTGKLVLNWRTNEEPDLAGYLVYRTVNEAKRRNFVLVTSSILKDTTMIQLLPKHVRNQFFYQVVAVDTSFNRSLPSDFAVGRMPDVLVPERPQIKKVTYESGVSIIEWIGNVDRDLAGYYVYRSDSSELLGQRVNVDIVARDIVKFSDRSAFANHNYFYRVAAVDSAGNESEFSPSVQAFREEKKSIEISTIIAQIRFQKRSKLAIIKWDAVELVDDSLLGYVIHQGLNSNSMKPETGLMQGLVYRKQYERDQPLVFQIRGYTKNGIVLKSELLELSRKIN